MKQTKQYLELSKDISLRQFFPDKLLALRKNRTCDVVLPEWLFDMDYPGLYLRQIKSVNVSVQCTAAPGTTISCKLSLRNSKYRLYPTLEFAAYTHEAHYKHLWQPVDAIVTSNAQDDDGFFNCKFHDENYKPFDKAGVMGKWRIELPSVYAQFDYDTITDIVLHIDYTAIDEGFLKDAASRYVQDALAGLNNAGDGFMQLLDIKADFATALANYTTGFATDNTTGLKLALTPQRFPYFTHNRQITISGLKVEIVPGNTLPAGSKLHIHYKQGNSIYELVVDVDTPADKTVSPVLVIKGNTKLLKLVLKDASGQPLNIDAVLKSLYVIALCKCGKDVFTTTDADDIDTWDGDVIAEPGLDKLATPQLSYGQSNGSVVLNWTSVSGAASYLVQRSATSSFTSGNATEVYSGTALTTTLAMDSNTTRYFRIRAISGDEEHADSLFSTALSVSKLLTPTLNAFAGEGEVTLTWDSVSSGATYKIEQSVNSNFSGASEIYNGMWTASVTATGTGGTALYFRITASKTGYINSSAGTVTATPDSGSTLPENLVTWKVLNNQDGTTNPRVLTATANGLSSCWAYADQSIGTAGGTGLIGYVSFTCDTSLDFTFIGLTNSLANVSDFAYLTYGIYSSNGHLWESGTDVAAMSSGGYPANLGDVIRFDVYNDRIEIFKNGTLELSRSATPTYPLTPVVIASRAGDAFSDILIDGVNIVATP